LQIQSNLSQNVGIVVPTLGSRSEYLKECLSSLRAQSIPPKIYVVAPRASLEKLSSENSDLFDEFVEDPGLGLAAAINKGIAEMDEAISFVTWLGDDDLLLPGAIETSLNLLLQNQSSVATFGGINVIDALGKVTRSLRAQKSALWFARFLSNHIYQPGSLIRRDAMNRIKFLDESLGWAFDLDMFFKLSKLGEVVPNQSLVANFRWHDDSLSAGSSGGSIKEASKVRMRHLYSWLRPIAWAWELPHVSLALLRTKKVTK
jgi:GT2 family glycosyltransferase